MDCKKVGPKWFPEDEKRTTFVAKQMCNETRQGLVGRLFNVSASFGVYSC